jgi:hypothetical protein
MADAEELGVVPKVSMVNSPSGERLVQKYSSG